MDVLKQIFIIFCGAVTLIGYSQKTNSNFVAYDLQKANRKPSSIATEQNLSETMNQLTKEATLTLSNDRLTPRMDQSHTFMGYPVFCPNDDSCPWSEGVGLITIGNDSCVATLVEKQDIILTAGHCLKEVHQDQGLITNGSFFLPSIKQTKDGRKLDFDIITLKKIIAKSDFVNTKLDFAFVSLDRKAKGHKPVKISREGFKNNTFYQTIGLDLIPSSPSFNEWNLRKTCFSSFKNIMTPEYNHSKDAFISLSNCAIGAGNSGAPVLNSNGEIVGVIKGHINMSMYKKAHRYLFESNFIDSSQSVFLAGATNLACLPDLFQSNYLVDTACNQSGAEQLISKDDDKNIILNLFKKDLNLIEKEGNFVQSSSSFPGFRTTFIWTPKCIEKSMIESSEEKKYINVKIYSPNIDKYFSIKSNLSSASNTRMYLKSIKKSKYSVFVLTNEEDIIYEGTMNSCNN